MTTIVATPEGMASDSGTVYDAAITGRRNRKIHRIKGHLVGVSGSCSGSAEFLHALKKAKEDPIDYLSNVAEVCYDSYALILDPFSNIWHYDAGGIPYKTREPYAVTGSGGTLALAALEAGADAREAVKIAAKLDVYSNPPVKWVKL